MAAVAPSTIKRWADDGTLDSTRTAGGHRRILKQALEAYLSRQLGGDDHQSDQIREWIEALKSGDRYQVDALFLLARGRLGSWYLVADEIGAVLKELGEAWTNGKLTIAEEHLASETLARATSRISESLPLLTPAKPTLLACAEGEEHSLGLSLAELCVREAGFASLWLGRNTPTQQLVQLVEEDKLGAIIVSASSWSRQSGKLAAIAKTLEACCRPRSVSLYFGGEGPWPSLPDYGQRLRSFAELHQKLTQR